MTFLCSHSILQFFIWFLLAFCFSHFFFSVMKFIVNYKPNIGLSVMLLCAFAYCFLIYLSIFGGFYVAFNTGHIKTGSWKGRGNQYIQLFKVLYCKLLTNGKQRPAFPLEAVPGTEPQPQRWDAF